MIQVDKYIQHIQNQTWSNLPYTSIGKIISTNGPVFKAVLRTATLGMNVKIVCDDGEESLGEVVAIREGFCYVMPYQELSGVNANTKIFMTEYKASIALSEDLLGRIVDFNCEPLDDGGEIQNCFERRSIYGTQMNPLKRKPISEIMDTGVKAINGFMTLGKGQRIGIMAGSGVGKSVLMGMLAKNSQSQVNVIGLIGERGREVNEFIQNELGEKGLERSTLVVATSDMSPLMRIRAAYTTLTIAEYFADQGKDVLLMMDSLTRFAMACREVSLSVGEPPGPKGYGPSVFGKLPKLIERAGNREKGSITGIFTVLVEGDDFDEPVADTVRSITDGHIMLSRELAAKNHYPAIDVLSSVSRVMNNVVTREHRIVAAHLRDLLAQYKDAEDLINVGAYESGTNIKIDRAVAVIDDLNNLLKQGIEETQNIGDLYEEMVEVAKVAEKKVNPDLFEEKVEEDRTGDLI